MLSRMSLKREDGTSLELIPQITKRGDMRYKTFTDGKGQKRKLASFLLVDEELSETRPDLSYREILLDMDPELLVDDGIYRKEVADNFLALSKLENVFDYNGRLCRRYNYSNRKTNPAGLSLWATNTTEKRKYKRKMKRSQGLLFL